MKKQREENKTLMEEARNFIESGLCPIDGCDKFGTIATQGGDGDVYLEQCKWCDDKQEFINKLNELQTK